MRNRIFYKLLLSYLAIILVFTFFSAWMLYVSTQKSLLNQVRENLTAEAEIVRNRIRNPPVIQDWDTFCKETGPLMQSRLTLIDAEGRVLGDSEADPLLMDNHLQRPEIREALRFGSGTGMRKSRTVANSFFYVALSVEPGTGGIRFIRLARPAPQIQDVMGAATRGIPQALFLGAVFALVVALALSYRVSRRVRSMSLFARRVSRGDFGHPLTVRSRDEVGVLEKTLNVMGKNLKEDLLSLSHANERLEVILDAISEGIVLVDHHRKILLSNREFRRLFDLRGEKILGKGLHQVVGQPEVVRHMVRMISSFQPEGVEIRTEGEGDGRDLRCEAVPIVREKEKQILFIFHDMTPQKRIDEIRSRFVANASHEMKTPLTAMRGFLETLQAGALEDPGKAGEFIGIALEHTGRLDRLLRDLLTLSEIESGSSAIRPETLLLEPVLNTAMETLHHRAVEKGIRLDRRIEPGVRAVYADRERLTQVLINLLDNAVKYTPAGGEVSLSAEEVYEQDIRGIRIRVKDNGIGIPAECVPHLGERFYRVDPSRSRELGGTGLGLAIVKHLLKAHGSRMMVRSEVQKGTEVSFVLRTASEKGSWGEAAL